MSGYSEERLRWYEALKSCFERLLYDYDPEGMGSTVGAPFDEYSDVATSLIRALRDRDPVVAPAESISQVVPGATTELVAEIEQAWEDAKPL